MNAQVEGADKLPKKSPGRPRKVEVVEEVKPTDAERVAKMNEMAQRQWNGQSPNLNVGDRAARIRAGMKGHGFGDILDQLDIDDSIAPSHHNPNNGKFKQYV